MDYLKNTCLIFKIKKTLKDIKYYILDMLLSHRFYKLLSILRIIYPQFTSIYNYIKSLGLTTFWILIIMVKISADTSFFNMLCTQGHSLSLWMCLVAIIVLQDILKTRIELFTSGFLWDNYSMKNN